MASTGHRQFDSRCINPSQLSGASHRSSEDRRCEKHYWMRDAIQVNNQMRWTMFNHSTLDCHVTFWTCSVGGLEWLFETLTLLCDSNPNPISNKSIYRNPNPLIWLKWFICSNYSPLAWSSARPTEAEWTCGTSAPAAARKHLVRWNDLARCTINS